MGARLTATSVAAHPSRQSFGARRRRPKGQPLWITPSSGVTWSDPECLSTGGVSGLCPTSRLTERGAAVLRPLC